MKILVIIAIVFFSMRGVQALTGYTFLKSFDAIFSIGFGHLKKLTETTKAKNDESLRLMSIKQKKSSKLFWYYCLINDIIKDLDWQGVNVEGFTTVNALVVFAAGFILIFTGANIIVALLTSMLLYAVLIAVLYTFSRQSHMARRRKLWDAENAICGSIGANGVVEAVKLNVDHFDQSIQPAFIDFVNACETPGLPFVSNLECLNLAIGSDFDDFCDKALTFTQNYRLKSEDMFRINIEVNGFQSQMDEKNSRYYAEQLQDYLMCIAILAVLLVFSLLNAKSAAFYMTTPGRLLMLAYLAFASGVFILYQVKMSRKVGD